MAHDETVPNHHENSINKWRHPTLGAYVEGGFLDAVHAVIPPGSKLSPNSKIEPSNLGKIPGRYDARRGCWYGYDWNAESTTQAYACVMDSWPVEFGLGLCTERLPAIDNDGTVPRINDAVLQAAEQLLGPGAPRRYRSNSERFLLMYGLADGQTPVPKMRIAYTHPSTGDTVHAVEILGRGQQFVAEGVHPSGVPYLWDIMTESPADIGADAIPVVSSVQLFQFAERVERLIVECGGTIKQTSKAGEEGERKPIGDGSLRAPDLQELAEALKAIPNDRDYQTWMGFLHALKAACGGDEGFFRDHVMPWCLQYGGNTPEVVEIKWDSIGDSSIGADYVFMKARDNGFKAAVREFEALPETPLTSNPVLAKLLADYFVAQEGGKTVICNRKYDEVLGRHYICRQGKSDLRLLYENDPSKPDVQFVRHPDRKTYENGMVFLPGRDAPAGCYNLWRGWGDEPEAGKCDLIQAHMRDVLCSGKEELYHYFWNWLARMVQSPTERGHPAIVLLSEENRTGKSIFAHFVRRICGAHGLMVTDPNHVTGRFNEHLRDVLLLHAEESFFARDPREASKLKALVADEVFTTEAKYGPVVQVANCTHIIMCSNSRHVVPADPYENERYFVLEVSAHRRGDRAYFEALQKQMDEGGAAAFLYELLNTDLNGFDVRTVPQTAALVEQKIHSLRGTRRWWFELLHDGVLLPGDFLVLEGPDKDKINAWEAEVEVAKKSLYQSYLEWAGAVERNAFADSKEIFAGVLNRALKGTSFKGHRPRKGNPRRERYYVMPPRKDCRQAFERFIGGDPSIWDDALDDALDDAA